MHTVPITTTAELGAQVRARRTDASLTQATLAARAGVSRKLVIDIEAGKPRLEVVGVLAVLEALGLHLALVPAEPTDAAPPSSEVPW